MQINHFLPNAECIGKHFTVAPAAYDEKENDGYYDVYGSKGQILYMLGESVEVTGMDEKRQMVSMRNEQNDEEWENFEISFEQFQRDFGSWPPSELERDKGEDKA